VLVALERALIEHISAGGGVLGDELHRAMHDRVADIALARERRIVARRPARPSAVLERDQPRRARGFGFGRAEEFF
jgi:hypothetical protein